MHVHVHHHTNEWVTQTTPHNKQAEQSWEAGLWRCGGLGALFLQKRYASSGLWWRWSMVVCVVVGEQDLNHSRPQAANTILNLQEPTGGFLQGILEIN